VHDRIVEQRRDGLLLSTDRSRIDVDAVLAMLHRSHWGGGITRDVLVRAVPNSVCIGVYDGTRQLAFARAITDLATYAYLSDVIVHEDARGRGLGSWMIEAILGHPDLQHLRRIALFTRDARELYERYGFAEGSTSTSIYMERRPERG
jgi:ribosomal protein S18 acetylase RimI-like enzyme